MELLLSDEQSMLRDSAATFAERRGGAARLRILADSESKIERNVWQAAAEAGWLAVLAPEEDGGLGLGLTELCLVSHELGRALIAAPIASAASVARAVAGHPLAAEITAGEKIVLPALAEGARAIGDEQPLARLQGDALDGRKTGVPCPADADGFLVTAGSGDGFVLAFAQAQTVEAAPAMDGTNIGGVGFSGSSAVTIAGENDARARLSALLDSLHLSTAAELLGIAEQAHAITVDYLKIRQQFDRPIGSFQALQHRAVDSLAAIEMCRSLVYQAARAIDGSGGMPGLASAALSKVVRTALDGCKTAVQLHGGIGFTHEHDIGLYLKRAMTLSALYGNAGLHRKRYAAHAEGHV